MRGRPWYVVLTVPVSHGRGHNHDRQADGRRQDPVTDVDDLGVSRRAEVERLDGMADGDVTVHTHGGEREDAGEHVVVVDGEHHLAELLTKGPGAHQEVDALKGQRAGGQGICQGQVEDIDVGGCFHFRVSGMERSLRPRGRHSGLW